MKTLTPKVRLLATMKPVIEIPDGSLSPSMELLSVAAAKSTRNMNPLESIMQNILDDLSLKEDITNYEKWGHFTVFEFTQFMFEITGIDRACSHELVRTRTAAFLQQSQRHYDPTGDGNTLPQSVIDKDYVWEYENYIERGAELYKNMVRSGIPMEDAREVLTNSTSTRVVMIIDGRNLMHLLKLRLDPKAWWQIREVADLMWGEAMKVCPTVFSKENAQYWWK